MPTTQHKHIVHQKYEPQKVLFHYESHSYTAEDMPIDLNHPSNKNQLPLLGPWQILRCTSKVEAHPFGGGFCGFSGVFQVFKKACTPSQPVWSQPFCTSIRQLGILLDGFLIATAAYHTLKKLQPC